MGKTFSYDEWLVENEVEEEESTAPESPSISLSYSQRKDPSWWDAVKGGVHSGASNLKHLAERGGEHLGNLIAGRGLVDPELSQARDNYLDLISRHPEWTQLEAEGAWDLLTHPKKLAFTAFQMLPYVAFTGGAGGVGAKVGAKVLGKEALKIGSKVISGKVIGRKGFQFAFASMIESQRATNAALDEGATDKEAIIAGVGIGTINGLIEMMQVGDYIKFAKGQKSLLVQAATKKFFTTQGLKNLSSDMIKLAAVESLEEVMQGSVDEIGSNLIYHKEIDKGLKGFLDRRATEAIASGGLSFLLGTSSIPTRHLLNTQVRAKAEEIQGILPTLTEQQSLDVAAGVLNPQAAYETYKAEQMLNPENIQELPEPTGERPVLETILGLTDFSEHMRGNLPGLKVTQLADDTRTHQNYISGPFHAGITALEKGRTKITRDGKAWLGQLSDDGHTKNITLLQEGKIEAPVNMPEVQAYGELWRSMKFTMGQYAMDQRILQQDPSGAFHPLVAVPGGKVSSRHYTEEMQNALNQGEGPIYDEYLKVTQEMNPDRTTNSLKRDLRDPTKAPTELMVSTLERGRKIRNQPDVIFVDGKQIDVFDKDPIKQYKRDLEQESLKISMNKFFGESKLATVEDFQLKKTAQILTGEKLTVTKDVLTRRFVEQGGDLVTAKSMTIPQLKKSLKEVGIPAKVTREDSLKLIMNLTVDEFQQLSPKKVSEVLKVLGGVKQVTKEQIKGIVAPGQFPQSVEGQRALKIAEFNKSKIGTFKETPGRKFKKINEARVLKNEKRARELVKKAEQDKLTTEQKAWINKTSKKIPSSFATPVASLGDRALAQELLADIQFRSSQVLEDRWKGLREEYLKIGSNKNYEQRKKTFDKMQQLVSDLPIAEKAFQSNWAARSAKLMLDVIGSAQISLAAIVNWTQPLLLVPGLAGAENYLKGQYNATFRPKATEIKGLEAGAYKYFEHYAQYEGEWSMETLGSLIKDKTAKFTLLSWRSYRNNIIAAESFRFLAKEMQQKGIVKGSKMELRAKELRLSNKEISELNDGKLSDELESKIMQNGVSITQYVTEPRHRQGLLTSSPYLRQLFPYKSYEAGNIRRMMSISRGFVDNMRKGNSKLAWSYGVQFLTMMGSYAGVGYLTEELRRAITGAPSETEKDPFEMLSLGLVQSSVFGPATRMLFFSNPYDSTVGDIALGLMPKVKASMDVFANVVNTGAHISGSPEKGLGTWAESPVGAQWLKLGRRHFGAFRSVAAHIERTVFPHQDDYYLAREYVAKFKEDHPRIFDKKQVERMRRSRYAMNPEYFGVHQAMRRGDVRGLQEEVVKYYRETKKDPIKARLSLASALRSDAPLKLGDEYFSSLMKSIPKKDRLKVLQAHGRYMDMFNLVVE